ncbi:MAG: hypothetical protein PHU64_06390 [Candidatus Omnitrophica bacterium]|nr:hypothetical protein [Candidatus Omnitrophota bacterium]MDD5429949.1 hypothetical protein [Candidatus Omnitrophota bacterium]
MKKIVFVAMFLGCSLLCSGVSAQELNQIITDAKKAVEGLKSVKMKGKTLTGAVNTTHEEGAIDYGKREFFGLEKSDSKVMSMIYIEEGVTYLYNGIFQAWYKFDKSLGLFDAVFDKDKLFSFFPNSWEEAGFRVSRLADEDIEGEPCFCVKSVVIDKDKAKDFALRFLDKFVAPQIAQELKKDKEFLNSYLDLYMSGSEYTQWISKSSSLVIKTLLKHSQMTGPSESVEVETETVYYDFNKPLTLEVPKEAYDAEWVSAEDLGLSGKQQ